ncbi:MAG TPA: PAS domain S-box protein [Verrucomicrobiae bacterium]
MFCLAGPVKGVAGQRGGVRDVLRINQPLLIASVYSASTTLLMAAAPHNPDDHTHPVPLPLLSAVLAVGIFFLLLAMWLVRQRERERQEVAKQLARVSELELEYRDLFDNASDLVYTHDMQGRYLTVNRAFADTFGYAKEELIGRNGFELLVEESRKISQAMFLQKLKDGQPTRYEADFITKDGRKLHAELVTRLVFRDGKPVGVHGVARDITKRRQEEFRNRVFLELGHKLNEANTHEAAGDTILEAAQQLIGFDSCIVYAVNKEQNLFRVLIQIDKVDSTLKRFPAAQDYQPLPPITKLVIEKGAQLILRTPEELAEKTDPSGLFGSMRRSASIVVVPIRSPERVLGVLGVHSYTHNAYDVHMQKMLEALADYCVGAFERISAREEMLATLAELERRVAERTAELSKLNKSLQEEVEERKRIEEALREAHAGLELRVKERTEELSRINVQLRKEIGGHRQTSAALQHSEQRFRSLIEASPVGIALSRSGIVLYANKAHLEMFGFTDQWQLQGRFFLDIIAPQCRDEVKTRITRRREAGLDRDSYETVGLRRDGSQFFYQVEAASIQLEDGPATLAFLIDTTLRHEAEQALRQSEERFSLAFHALPIPVSISTFAEGRLIDANEAFLHLFEHKREETIGKTALELGIWDRTEERNDLIDSLKRGESVRARECRYRTRSGRLVITSVSVERVELQGWPCLIFITQDLTERLNLETQLRHAQKMEAVGQLAAGVAHDFNNIMTIILGHASLLELEMAHDKDHLEALREITTASERAATLTRQLLTFSRKQIMQLRVVDLNELIRNFSRMLNRLLGEHVAVDLHFEPFLPAVKADAGMVEQIIMNLAVNARDAMTGTGCLSIATKPVMMEVNPRNPSRTGKFACLVVSDNGCGMDALTLGRIFEPFFTTKEVGKGTGLGLATVYAIVEQHHGWIEVESTPGAGTVFRVYLPVALEFTGLEPNLITTETHMQNKATVLVAEDEAAVLGLVTTILQKGGYHVISATSGDDALILWEMHRDEIDLLLTDMVMPGLLSGRGLAERIHEMKPDLPVIYSSGYSVEIVREGLVLREGVNFLPKPYPPTTLLQMVKDCLENAIQGNKGNRSQEV